MNFAITICLISLLALGCAKQDLKNETAYHKGTRDFRINADQPAVVVSLHGDNMGTPDTAAVWNVIQTAHNNGWLTNLVTLNQPTEGGVNHCLEIQEHAKRTQILNSLQGVVTSDDASHYSVTSVDQCS